MYKLIAIDIDDTLLNNDIQITSKVQDAIQKAIAKGTKVVLCTGRTLRGAERFYDQLGLDTLFITAGGAEIYDPNKNRLFEVEVDPALTKQILEYAYSKGIHAQVYIDGDLVYRERNEYSQLYEGPYGYPGTVIEDLLDIERIVTPKVLFVVDENKAEAIQQDAETKFPTLSIKRSKPIYIEFTPRSISKATALEFVADYYSIDLKDTIAVGDAQIDAPMILAAGLGVAVENAPDSLKSIADVICPSNEDDGVAYVIEKYILEAFE